MIRCHEMPFGAAPREGGGVRFRLWAPAAGSVALVLGGAADERRIDMARDGAGWHEAVADGAGPGTRYAFQVDGRHRVPDPASRFQPDGVHRASEVVDPAAFDWPDAAWRGRPWEEAVLYELHVGTFTPEGTFAAAAGRLDHLARLGVTALELMPLAQAPGSRNWGYDGVELFAPSSNYGRPEDLKALVAAAHDRGLMVLLDVVYNHFGPEGNYLHLYAPQFFTERHHTPWGAAIDFEGPASRTVRDFFIENALYWLEEYHLDGLRLDAVHAIFDESHPDFLGQLARSVRARLDGERHVHLVLENDRNEARRLAREAGGRPRFYTAQWNDDAHHAWHALLTGEREGYYVDYVEDPLGHVGRTATEGFAYQGEPSAFRGGANRGEPSAHLPPTAFVTFLQNHDQVGNRAFGERIDALAPDEAIAAALAVVLLAPSPPMLFMGEEWGARTPFPFFCDFGPDLAEAVRDGRRREFARFAAFHDPAARARIPDPTAAETWRSAVLDWDEPARAPHAGRLALVRELLDLRRREIVPRIAGIGGDAATAARFGAGGLDLRWRLADGTMLRCLANLAPEPASPPAAVAGRLIYAGPGTVHGAAMPAWSVAWHLAEDAG